MTEIKAKGDVKLVRHYESARMCSVPLVAVRSADQMATVAVLAALKFDEKVAPAILWDQARGLTGVNPEGTKLLKETFGQPKPGARSGGDKYPSQDETQSFVTAMIFVGDLQATASTQNMNVVTFVLNAHRQFVSGEPLATAANVQAVANNRDALKKNFRMIVFLGPGFLIPSELTQDIVVLNHELPDADALGEIADSIYRSAKASEATMPDLTADVRRKAVDAMSGLSGFAAEQQYAMSLTPQGLNLDALWERARITISQTKGLKVLQSDITFKDIVGCEQVKEAMQIEIDYGVGVVVFIDEIDKAMANVEHDTTGVRMDQLRTLLTEMEDNEWEGMVLMGQPGSAKSMLGKAMGNEAGCLTIALDLAGMEGSLVGESEAAIRQAIAVIKAVGRGKAYLVATSNNATPMRPEMERRFTGGTYYFDLLTPAQRRAAWDIYLAKYGFALDTPLPDDTDWTGAEIRNCCRTAWKSQQAKRPKTVKQVGSMVVPVAKRQKETMLWLRWLANGRYLDANKPGLFDATNLIQQEVIQKLGEQHLRAMRMPTRKEEMN